MSRPEPRPALQRADDGSVHPAAPRVAAEQHLHPVPHAPVAARRATSASGRMGFSLETAVAGATPKFTGKPVTLSVEIPKDLRKEARRLAERAGMPVDAVVTEALTHYVGHVN
ncbi:MAG: hypothetical protein ACJ73J_08450 [Actinomycetes bacterium]